jgi:hypothetical protein
MALLGQMRCIKCLAKVCQFHVHVRFRGHVHFRDLSVSVSVSMSVSLSMFISVSISISMLFQFKYGAMNIYGRHGNYIVDSQWSYEVAGKLKGPLI